MSLRTTTTIILTLTVLVGLSNLTAYSETQKGIANADGTFLVPTEIISSNLTHTTTPNVHPTNIRIEISSDGHHHLAFDINGEKNELELTMVDDILYLPKPDVKGNEVHLIGGIVWNYAAFYTMINE